MLNLLSERKKNPHAGQLLDYDDANEYSQGYGVKKGTFRSLTEDDTFIPYISNHDVRSKNGRAAVIGIHKG